MTTTAATAGGSAVERHPKGLYVLFFAEMWERFSFYSMLAMFTLYMQDKTQGFGWSDARATSLYANYLMFVYASPLIGGWLADRFLGYRRATMIGAVFFMAGHALLGLDHIILGHASLSFVYAALVCLCIGNGFFKPNVSAMVGQLYAEGSPLKERAYNIFYMGINIGALLAPICAELVQSRAGYHIAFTVAAAGMLLSLLILAFAKKHIEAADRARVKKEEKKGTEPIDAIPDSRRIAALIVVFLAVIVFWMVFHQNGSTITYFAENNTSPHLPGILSNAINSGYVVLFTFPLIWFWMMLRRKGKEPSIPTKMAIGMLLTGLSFVILYFAGKAGGDQLVVDGKVVLVDGKMVEGKIHPSWIFGSYAVVTIGELMLSPMGLALVSKVSPLRFRGLMMGGWFVATAIGNKLTQIGVFWSKWPHSTFFIVLAGCAIVMAAVMLGLNRWLKRSMPGV